MICDYCKEHFERNIMFSIGIGDIDCEIDFTYDICRECLDNVLNEMETFSATIVKYSKDKNNGH